MSDISQALAASKLVKFSPDDTHYFGDGNARTAGGDIYASMDEEQALNPEEEHPNRQLLHKLDAQFEALERSTRAMASRAVRGADVKNAIVAGSLAQLRAVEWTLSDEKGEAA